MSGLSKKELIKIALKLKNNIDEAEQLSDYIDDLIAHCDKEFLQGFVRNLALSVQQNLEMPSFRENIVDDENELVALVDFILGGDV